MSPGISLALHWWRGFGPDVQPDLFWWRYRLGFATLSIERADLWEAYRKIRDAMVKRVENDREGR